MRGWRGILLFLLAGTLVMAGTAAGGDQNKKRTDQYVQGDVLVVFKAEEGNPVTVSSLRMGRDAFRVASIATSCGAWVKETYEELSEEGNSVFVLLHSGLRSTDQLIEELSGRSDVLAISPNYKVHAADTAVNDPLSPSNELWGLKAVHAPGAWDTTTGSGQVYVAVLDTGIDDSNPDLADNVDRDLSRNFCTPDSSAFMDENGHGTYVAGIIGAVGNNHMGLVGMNWAVRLIALKVLDAEGEGTVSGVVQAVNYLTGLLNDYPDLKLAAVNLSLVAYDPTVPAVSNLARSPLWRALKALDKLNRAVITVAAGNEGIEVGTPAPSSGAGHVKGDYVYPASYRGLNTMLTVAAVSSDLTLASFSNWNADVTAPGVRIYSTLADSIAEAQDIRYRAAWLQDGTKVGVASGTSAAAPHAAGAAALLLSAAPDLTAFQLRNALVNSAGATDDLFLDGPLDSGASADPSEAIEPVEALESVEETSKPASPDRSAAASLLAHRDEPFDVEEAADTLSDLEMAAPLEENSEPEAPEDALLEEALTSGDETADESAEARQRRKNLYAQERLLNVKAALEIALEDLAETAAEDEYDVAYENGGSAVGVSSKTGGTGCNGGFAGAMALLVFGLKRNFRAKAKQRIER